MPSSTSKVILLKQSSDLEVQEAERDLGMMEDQQLFNQQMSVPEMQAMNREYKIVPEKKKKGEQKGDLRPPKM